MIKVGIVGLGRMGMLHLMNCIKIDGVQVVAVVDSSKKAVRKAKSFGVNRVYANYHELFNHPSELDAVVISLPNFLHFDSIKLALEAGLDVFSEKPMASSVEECSEIVKQVDKTDRKLMVGHVVRFYDVVERMKENLDKGMIGNLEVATIEEVINGPFTHSRVPAPVSDWWFDPKKSGGGVLIDIGYHMIDLFRFFAGDAKVIFSCLDHKFNLPVEDGAIVILQSCNSSAKGIINVGWYQKTIYPQFDFNLVLHGNAGYLPIKDYVPKNMYWHAVKEGTKNLLRRLIGVKIRPLSYTYYYESFYRELNHFFDCIRYDSDPAVSAVDGLKTMELVDMAYRNRKSINNA